MTTTDATWQARFRALREQIGSQERFAERYGISRRTIMRWESGENLPNRTSAEKLAKINPDMAALMAEIPEEKAHRMDLHERVEAVEAYLSALDQRIDALHREAQALSAAFEQARPRSRRGARASREGSP